MNNNADIIYRKTVLRVNRGWQAIGDCTVKDALVAMNSGNEFLKAAFGMNIEYNRLSNGDWDFTQPLVINPVEWDEWLTLPIRNYDDVIHTSKLTIRVPTVIIAQNFQKMPKCVRRVTPKGIWERDRGTCQYTGAKLTKHTGNLDHIVPESRGGRTTWENVVLCSKEINAKKGNKLNHEAGLKLLRKPVAPLPTPLSALIQEARHRDWAIFMQK